jgi:hypothetical protein
VTVRALGATVRQHYSYVPTPSGVLRVVRPSARRSAGSRSTATRWVGRATMRVGQSILRGSGITLPVAAPNGEEGGRRVMAKSSTAKVTSKRVARQASAALRDGRSSKRTGPGRSSTRRPAGHDHSRPRWRGPGCAAGSAAAPAPTRWRSSARSARTGGGAIQASGSRSARSSWAKIAASTLSFFPILRRGSCSSASDDGSGRPLAVAQPASHAGGATATTRHFSSVTRWATRRAAISSKVARTS